MVSAYGVMNVFSLVGSVISVLVYLCAIFTAVRHRHQSPWLYLIMVGFLGAISSHSGSILLRLLLLSGSNTLLTQISSGPLSWFLGLCGFAGWLGGISVAAGVIGLVTDMVRRFNLWRDVQKDVVDDEQVAARRPGEGPS